MELRLSDDLRMLRRTVRQFVKDELMPLELQVLKVDWVGNQPQTADISPDDRNRLDKIARDMGLWALTVPVDQGGAGLGKLALCLVIEELAKTAVPFSIRGQVPDMLLKANGGQASKYLKPSVGGEKRWSVALRENTARARSNPLDIESTAKKDGNSYVINGLKSYIPDGASADFTHVFARSDDGMTCFLIDRGTPGFSVSREIPTMGEWIGAELKFDNCCIDAGQVLGSAGQAEILAIDWLTSQQMEISARCMGIAERCLKMAVEYSKQRVTFSQPLATRQAIQWMFAESAVEMDCSKWMIYELATKADTGADIRQEAALTKTYAAEMAGKVVDRALQVHGGLGYTRDLPIERWYREVRLYRILDGSSEVERLNVVRRRAAAIV